MNRFTKITIIITHIEYDLVPDKPIPIPNDQSVQSVQSVHLIPPTHNDIEFIKTFIEIGLANKKSCRKFGFGELYTVIYRLVQQNKYYTGINDLYNQGLDAIVNNQSDISDKLYNILSRVFLYPLSNGFLSCKKCSTKFTSTNVYCTNCENL